MTIKSNIIPRRVEDFFHSEFREYSLYTVHSRAIPSLLDGFKPVQRKVVWTATRRAKSWVKVVALGGYVIAESNYHHGDKSVSDAITKLAANWSNNVPVLQSDEGNFGWRLAREPASPRYITCRMSPHFNNWFGDANVLQYVVQDDGQTYEPVTYYSRVPWSLINGCVGIATGYAVNIYPRDPVKVVKAIRGLLEGVVPNESDFYPSFPEDPGGSDGYELFGTVKHVKRDTWDITSLPATYTLDSYTTKLDKMVETGVLKSYQKTASRKSPPFRIVVSKAPSSPDKLVDLLKLRVSLGSETFSMIHEGKLMVFDSMWDYIGKFMEERMKICDLSIKDNIRSRQLTSEKLGVKKAFVHKMVTEGLDGLTRAELKKRAESVCPRDGALVSELVQMGLGSFTLESLSDIDRDVSKLKEEVDKLGGVSPELWFKESLLSIGRK